MKANQLTLIIALLGLPFDIARAFDAAAIPDSVRADADVQALLVAVSARQRLADDYQKLTAEGALGEVATRDYADYLADFEQRIAEQCFDLLKTHPELKGKIPCESEQVPSARQIAIPDTPLPEDEVSGLEAELAQGLGDFDDMLLREQEKLASQSARASASSGGGGGASGSTQGDKGDQQNGDSSAGAGSESAASGERNSGREGRTGNGQSSSRGGSFGSSGKHASAPRDKNRGSTDDVVARQLREAAEKETDPELRKKLWEEYRRYKQGG